MALACAGFFAGQAIDAAARKSSKKPPAKTASKSTSGGSKSRKKSSKSKAKRVSVRQAPDEARVREIQQALAARGYDVEVTGTWGSQSIEALKKFQEDKSINNLSGRGKLDSLTLIALGLGPSRPPAASGAPLADPARGPERP